jgi:hypothetical protein
VLFLDGRCCFVTQGTDAEREWLDAGAVHVGLVRFDTPPAGPPRGSLLPLDVTSGFGLSTWGSGHS